MQSSVHEFGVVTFKCKSRTTLSQFFFFCIIIHIFIFPPHSIELILCEVTGLELLPDDIKNRVWKLPYSLTIHHRANEHRFHPHDTLWFRFLTENILIIPVLDIKTETMSKLTWVQMHRNIIYIQYNIYLNIYVISDTNVK